MKTTIRPDKNNQNSSTTQIEKNGKMSFNREEILKKTTQYFNGDEMAAMSG